ncbi:unnamed protein product [Symbiodinium natans]|uniref:USP domain-containing protein n=1 Tax=Symbiodinium natans TaxID=878477 RepID=A0A812QQT5_9DINO|nr:unnamed protein product [Symbiodinium natans]
MKTSSKRLQAVQVFRDQADGEDLRLLAAECLGVSRGREDPASRSVVEGFCKAFQEISEGRWAKGPEAFNTFHLRDFHHCLRYLRRRGLVQNGSVSGQSVLCALERNFGGLKREQFVELCKVFFRHLQTETGGRISEFQSNWLRTTLEVLQEALEDIPVSDLQDANYEPCRYKLIIDETEDGGAVRILQSAGIFPLDIPVLEVSDLPGDHSDLHRSQVISDIRRAAERPDLRVMVDFDEILDGFYDLLNLRFQRIQADSRVSFAATVAAGSYSVLAPVDPRFQLVVCIKASDLAQTPLPFLNRFEKFYVGPEDLSMHTARWFCNQLSQSFLRDYLLQPVRLRLQALVQLLGPASLIGYDDATMETAINEALQAARGTTALKFLSSGWEESPAEDTAESIEAAEWPGDIGPGQRQQGTWEDLDPVCFGHENAGNTCFLQACLTILCVHEKHLLPLEHDAEPLFLSDLRHILKKSRRERVPREDVWSLAQKLARAKIIQQGQQEDAVGVFEALLDECKSPKLELPTMTCAKESDCLQYKYPCSKVFVCSDLNEWVLRTAMGADKSFDTLLQEIVMETVSDCKVEIVEEGETKEMKVATALRGRRRLLSKAPPSILPICFGRWDAERQKSDMSLSVPMEGLILPLVPPSQETLALSHVERWCYQLTSFIVHTGSLDHGHYVAYFKTRGGWQAVDNDRCSHIMSEEAKYQAGKAYLLVYRPDIPH